MDQKITEVNGVQINGITPSEAAKFESLFKLVDSDGTGGINEAELADLMPRMGVFLSEDEMHTLFCSVDSDGSGEIDFQEFLQLIARNREGNQLALLEGGRECFQRLKAAAKLKNVIGSDETISWVLDVATLAVILFWVIVISYEDVRQRAVPFYPLYWKVLASVIQLLDVARGLLTSVTQHDTLPVDDRTVVRRSYLRSRRFVIDAVAAIPADIVLFALGFDLAGRICQHLRILKLFVIPTLFNMSPRDTLAPRYAHFYFVFVPLCKICFWACFCVHLLTMLALIYSPGDIHYLDSMYFIVYTLTTTGYGDMKELVDTQIQRCFAIGLFCCASVVTGLVVGKLVQFSQQADLQTDANKRMLETLAALNYLTIPSDFKEEVLAFQLHRLKHSNSLFNEAISGLPDVMQDRMALYARMKIVR
eukprot:Rhum_TRINITY_DN12138_c0_g1::Rhum_TRINITY_DN12138_c0_g1_i1::g.49615::m.49615